MLPSSLCLCLWLPCLVAPPAAAAPWDGIVGFLQAVARVRGLDPNPEIEPPLEEEPGPLRRIVYAVEEQVTLGEPPPAPAQVVFDSAAPPAPLQANQTLHPDIAANGESPFRIKRSPSNDTAAEPEAKAPPGGPGHDRAGHGRATSSSSIVTRPIFLGRNLWYAPLWFGLYLMVYILVLVVKSIARHRIKYPTLVPAEKSGKRRGDYNRMNMLTNGVENAVSTASQRYRYGP